MIETIEEHRKIDSHRAAVKGLLMKLDEASKHANEANQCVVQLSWDLGDQLQDFKKNSPENYDAFLSGLNIPKEAAKYWIKVRNLAESKDELTDPNVMRQAMLAVVVPGKEEGEERVELAPPQTFYQWVNKSNSWLKKLEVGLVKYQQDQLKSATERLFEFLKKIHEG